MTPADAAEVLALAAAFDNRSVGEANALAWSAAVDERVSVADAKRIVTEHYARTREWVMPSDVNAASAILRRTRLDRMATPEPPETLNGDPGLELTWQRAYRRAIGDGHDESMADLIACRTVGTFRPQIAAAPRPVTRLIETAADGMCVPVEASRRARKEAGA